MEEVDGSNPSRSTNFPTAYETSASTRVRRVLKRYPSPLPRSHLNARMPERLVIHRPAPPRPPPGEQHRFSALPAAALAKCLLSSLLNGHPAAGRQIHRHRGRRNPGTRRVSVRGQREYRRGSDDPSAGQVSLRRRPLSSQGGRVGPPVRPAHASAPKAINLTRRWSRLPISCRSGHKTTLTNAHDAQHIWHVEPFGARANLGGPTFARFST